MKNRIRIQEYGPRFDAATPLSDYCGVSKSDAQQLLLKAAESVRLSTGASKSGLVIEASGVSAEGIAGSISLHPRVDLEIVPKYADRRNDAWKSDLLFLFLFSRYGSLFPRLSVSAGVQSNLDLLSIAALMLLSEIQAAAHRPLRKRQRRTQIGFDLHGQYDAAELALLSSEGIGQTTYEHSRDNEFGAVIRMGLSTLASRVRDPQIKEQLRHAQHSFGRLKIADVGVRWKRLPQRLAGWQAAYDLAFQFWQGDAMGLGADRHLSPGFVVDTWRMWQETVYRCCAMAFDTSMTFKEPASIYANSWAGSAHSPLYVEPDVLIETVAGRFVIDAKYKSRFSTSDRYARRIGASDLHQAAVTIPAASARKSILMLPSSTISVGNYRVASNTLVVSNQAEIAEIELGVAGVSLNHGIGKVVIALRNLFGSSFSSMKMVHR